MNIETLDSSGYKVIDYFFRRLPQSHIQNIIKPFLLKLKFQRYNKKKCPWNWINVFPSIHEFSIPLVNSRLEMAAPPASSKPCIIFRVHFDSKCNWMRTYFSSVCIYGGDLYRELTIQLPPIRMGVIWNWQWNHFHVMSIFSHGIDSCILTKIKWYDLDFYVFYLYD